jgi:hypothetical protein
VIALQQIAIGQHWNMVNALLFFMEFVDIASRVHNMWRYERSMGYMKNQFLGSFFENMFWQRTRLSYDTFRSLIKVMGTNLEPKIHT